MTAREYEGVAQWAAEELMRAKCGAVTDPLSWEFAAAKYNCLLVKHGCIAAPPGLYLRAQGEYSGIIAYNAGLPDLQRCLVLVHELAHHVMMGDSCESLFGYIRAYGYTSAEDARDLIARRVESIIFPGHRRSSKIREFQKTGTPRARHVSE